MKKLCLLFLVCIFLTPAPAAMARAGGATVTVFALGQEPSGANQAEAAKRAVSRAITSAVFQTALTLTDPATLREHLAVLVTKALAQPTRYLTSFAQQAVVHQGGKTIVLVTVTIDTAALKEALGKLNVRLQGARLGPVLVMVSEETSPGRPPVYWWSGAPGAPDAPPALAKVLKDAGARVLSPAALPQILPTQNRPLLLPPEQALALAAQAGAAKLIYGSIRTYPLVTPEGAQAKPFCVLAAYDVKEKKKLSEVSVTEPVFRESPGPAGESKVARAIVNATRTLVEKALGSPGPAAPQGSYMLHVSGITSLRQLLKLEEVLGDMKPLVSEIMRDSVTVGQATFRLKLTGPLSRLADMITVKDFGDFLVNVVSQTQGRLAIILVPKPERSLPSPTPKPKAPAAKPGG